MKALWDVLALAVYAGVSAVFLWRGVSLTDHVAGQGSDPYQFVWMLAWVIHALRLHQSLFYTHLMWQPLGVPMLWVSSVLLPSLMLVPLTLLAGPVVVYNLVILAAPVLAGYCAYRLCLRASGDPAASVLGGFVFGFSGAEMAMDFATPNLSLNFLLPCLALLALRRFTGESRGAVGIVLGVLGLAAQFFISIEMFATMVVFGALAWGLAWALNPEMRPGLMRLLRDAALTGVGALVLLSPALAEMFRHFGWVHIPSFWPYYFVDDPANLVVPTQLTLFGSGLAWPLAKHFPGLLQEQDAYLGLPLIVICVAYARRARGARHGAFWPTRCSPARWRVSGRSSGCPGRSRAFICPGRLPCICRCWARLCQRGLPSSPPWPPPSF